MSAPVAPPPAAPALRGLPPALAGRRRTLVMGVVNATPDSFSDGGSFAGPDEAVAHGRRLLAQGADVLDVGGESTRPGAGRVGAEEELRRVLPVVRGLVAAGAVVSVDTMRASTAQACLAAGASMVNDVSGGLADPAMAAVIAGAGVPYVVMHWRGHSATMQSRATYADVVAEVRDELARRLDTLAGQGVDLETVVVDPGIGFAKEAAHNWALLAALDELHGLGRPLLVGVSRKRFLGRVLATARGAGDTAVPPQQLDGVSAVLSALLSAAGAWGVRVHDVGATVDALAVTEALADARRTRAVAGP